MDEDGRARRVITNPAPRQPGQADVRHLGGDGVTSVERAEWRDEAQTKTKGNELGWVLRWPYIRRQLEDRNCMSCVGLAGV